MVNVTYVAPEVSNSGKSRVQRHILIKETEVLLGLEKLQTEEYCRIEWPTHWFFPSNASKRSTSVVTPLVLLRLRSSRQPRVLYWWSIVSSVWPSPAFFALTNLANSLLIISATVMSLGITSTEEASFLRFWGGPSSVEPSRFSAGAIAIVLWGNVCNTRGLPGFS